MSSNLNTKSSRTATERNGRKGGPRKRGNQPIDKATSLVSGVAKDGGVPSTEAADEETISIEDATICWICAEPVKFWSVSQCNHRTCHVCALRLRALYKRLDCTFCKHEQPTIIFTSSADELFEDYTPEAIPFKDQKLSISFETQEMMEETLILLRFNCPDTSCDFSGTGWNDLKIHVRAVHGRQLCDLCVRHKKVFAHEHALYTHAQLSIHLPTYARRPAHANLSKGPDKIEGGIHPYCEFCRESYFGDDELYTHMRERHEECFICKHNDVRNQYFEDYLRLERHFNDAHHPCQHPTCLAQKFVVFGSKLDLQAHSIETHQEDMSARDKRGARRVVEDIEFEQVARSLPKRNNRVQEGHTDRGGPSRSSRREAFGTSLSSPVSFPSLPTQPISGTVTPRGNDTLIFDIADTDAAVLERHGNFLMRTNALTLNSASAVASIKAAIRSYRSSESGARDLISTVFTVLNQDIDPSASMVNMIVDILDDEEKRKTLLAAWNSFKTEQARQFPDLVPNGAGSSYSGISSGRLLNVKRSTAPRTSLQSTRHMLDRVANAAASISSQTPERFPALIATSSKHKAQTAQRTTPWTAASGSIPSSSATIKPFSVPGSSVDVHNGRKQKPSQLSAALFPSLPPPPTTTAAEARQLVSGARSGRDTGDHNNVWTSVSSGPATQAEGGQALDTSLGRGKKKKGKEKQTLFTLGSFPS